MLTNTRDQSNIDKVRKNLKIIVVKSTYNSHITDKMEEGVREVFRKYQIEEISTIEVPGAYELIYGSIFAFKNIPNIDAIIALGCVIKGDTEHDLFINHAVAQALANLEIKHSIPIGFGLLTTNDEQQALDRSFGKHGNKGEEVAEAVIQSLHLQINTISL